MKNVDTNHETVIEYALNSYRGIISLCQKRKFKEVAILLNQSDFPHEHICDILKENYYGLAFTDQKNKPHKDKSFLYMHLFYFPELRKIMNKEDDSLSFTLTMSALGQQEYIKLNYSNTLIQNTFYFEALSRDWIYKFAKYESYKTENNIMKETIYDFYIDQFKNIKSQALSQISESYYNSFTTLCLLNFYKQVQYPFFYRHAIKKFKALNFKKFILKYPDIYTHQIYSDFFKDNDYHFLFRNNYSTEQRHSLDIFSFIKRLFSVNQFIKKHMDSEVASFIGSTDSILSITNRIMDHYYGSFSDERKNDFFWQKMQILIATFNIVEERDITYDIFLHFAKSANHLNTLSFEECALKKYFEFFCDNECMLDNIYLTNGYEIIPEHIKTESLINFRDTMMSKTIKQQKAALIKTIDNNIDNSINSPTVPVKKAVSRL